MRKMQLHSQVHLDGQGYDRYVVVYDSQGGGYNYSVIDGGDLSISHLMEACFFKLPAHGWAVIDVYAPVVTDQPGQNLSKKFDYQVFRSVDSVVGVISASQREALRETKMQLSDEIKSLFQNPSSKSDDANLLDEFGVCVLASGTCNGQTEAFCMDPGNKDAECNSQTNRIDCVENEPPGGG